MLTPSHNPSQGYPIGSGRRLRNFLTYMLLISPSCSKQLLNNIPSTFNVCMRTEKLGHRGFSQRSQSPPIQSIPQPPIQNCLNVTVLCHLHTHTQFQINHNLWSDRHDTVIGQSINSIPQSPLNPLSPILCLCTFLGHAFFTINLKMAVHTLLHFFFYFWIRFPIYFSIHMHLLLCIIILSCSVFKSCFPQQGCKKLVGSVWETFPAICIHTCILISPKSVNLDLPRRPTTIHCIIIFPICYSVILEGKEGKSITPALFP